MRSPSKKAFENVQHQIGFCGIWCGSCVVGNGTLTKLTTRYQEIIRAYDIGEWGPKDFDFEEFLRGLASIQAMPLCPGCLQGGGREACEMRACASSRQIADCTTCREFPECSQAKPLEMMRSGALDAGLFVKSANLDRHGLIEKWTAELRSRWPCSILFMKDR